MMIGTVAWVPFQMKFGSFGGILAVAVVLASHFLAALFMKESMPFEASETRCRKCQYILRGITEPRCPECGERI